MYTFVLSISHQRLDAGPTYSDTCLLSIAPESVRYGNLRMPAVHALCRSMRQEIVHVGQPLSELRRVM